MALLSPQSRRRAVDNIPIEIIRFIIRLATEVPEAFDTSCDFVLDEDRVRTRRLITESLTIKTSLALVSKTFQLLVDEYLYEIVLVTRFVDASELRRLASLLRQHRRGGLTPRGHRVRRLELHFHLHQGDEWTRDWNNLWGILPECPNLETLLFYPQRRVRQVHLEPRPHLHNVDCVDEVSRPYSPWPFKCDDQFMKNVERACEKTLRRLDLGRCMTVSSRTLSSILSNMQQLEILYSGESHWSRVQEFNDPANRRTAARLRTLLCSIERLQKLLPPLPALEHLSVIDPYGSSFDEPLLEFAHAHSHSIISLFYHTNVQTAALSELVQLLPKLQHLRLVDFMGAEWDAVFPEHPHDALHTLTVFRPVLIKGGWSLMDDADGLLLYLQKNRFPGLKKVRIAGRRCQEHLPRSCSQLRRKLAEIGIDLEMRPDVKAWYTDLKI